MSTPRRLTVRDTLDTPMFGRASVVAGSLGLDREIRWVHVLEIAHADGLLHGGEMILTTGVGLRGGSAERHEFLKSLITRGAACLCIELGTYIPSVPLEWMALAEQFGFPLIVFAGTVRYVDITHDLHRLILSLQQPGDVPVPRHNQRLDKDRIAWLLDGLDHGLGAEAWRRDQLLQPFERRPCRTMLLRLGPAEHDRRRSAAASPDEVLALQDAAVLMKTGLERAGWPCLAVGESAMITLVIADDFPADACREALHDGLEMLTGRFPFLSAGVGEAVSGRMGAAASRRQAQHALDIAAALGSSRVACRFYEELGVLQLLPALNDGSRLEAFVDRHLGPLLLADRLKGSDLLLTLKVFLDAEGSKQEAARRLYIVRQSLYYRLERIGELLGSQWLLPERRLAIQVALRAHMLLHPHAFQERETETSSAGHQPGDSSAMASRSAASRKSKSSSVLESGGASVSTLL